MQNIKEWHDWYAWHPVRIGERCVWLESVKRKWNPNGGHLIAIASFDHGEMSSAWEYRRDDD